jgi:transcriptional regulator with PAS, ATPase and Fis domain
VPPPTTSPAFSWRALFEASATAVFVVGGDRTLRYANPAWEKLTDSDLEKLRGTKFAETRESASPLWKSLAPPPEAWAGPVARVRRPVAGSDDGPPWWDVTFLPLLATDGAMSAVVGTVTVVGDTDPTPAAFTPAAVGAARSAVAGRFTLEALAGVSPASGRLAAQVRAAANSDAPVWVRGEPGSGKETVARVIHHTGHRRERAYLGVECAGLQPHMIDGLLSGKGGLTAGPHVGTVVLKNPAALSRDVQRRLLEWVSGTNGPRLICTATEPPTRAVRSGQLLPSFETDCAALEIAVPPLRDRPDDLPRLVDRLLDRVATPTPALAEDVLPVLRAYRWPGNVRELSDTLMSALDVANGERITRDHLPRFVREAFLLDSNPQPPAKAIRFDAVMEEVERRLVTQALAQVNGNLTAAASRLGIPRERLVRRLKFFGLPHYQLPDKS